MKDFVIFFHGHEGSSATISQLKKLNNYIDVIGFEPFDANKKPLIDVDMKKMFNLLFTKHATVNYVKNINNIYNNYYKREFPNFNKKLSVGFKMRPKMITSIQPILKKNNVVVFVLFRQNILKWAISKCRPNSYQFKLLQGKIQQNPKLNIDIALLDKKIQECRNLHEQKRKLLKNFINNRIIAYPIYYEKMCEDKEGYFKDILKKLDVKISDKEFNNFISKENFFKKVHSDNLEDFITNYDELMRYVKDNNLENYI